MPRAPRPPGNLPAEVTSFVGRRLEVDRVRRRVVSARSVTLVGTGGVGKTRLALRAATRAAARFPDGTWWADLGELHDPTLVAGAVLAALDVHDHAAARPDDLLRAVVGERRLLLVLDGCERVRSEVARILTGTLRACPGLHVLATSRTPLGTDGEHVHPVAPLEVPVDGAAAAPRTAGGDDAVALFVERAAAATGDFVLTTDTRDAVVELCRRLDGLPLAIELAAVRTRSLGPHELLERLGDRFALLTGPAPERHRTLEAAVTWSHDLLTPREQVLLRRLTVFAGRFTLAAAESVCADDDVPVGSVLDALASLVDRSFVVRDDVARTAAFRMHETMRDYGRARLRAAGEEPAVEQRWIAYHLARRAALAPGARLDLLTWLDVVELELDDLRAVLRVLAVHRDTARALDLCAALCWYWVTRATSEGVRRLDALLGALPGASDAPRASHHPWALFTRGFLAVLQHDPQRASEVLAVAVEAARVSGDPDVLAQSQAMAAIAAALARVSDDAVDDAADDPDHLLTAARATADGAPAPQDVGTTLMVLQATAMVALLRGEHGPAEAAAAAGITLARRVGDLYSTSMLLLDLSLAGLGEGRTGDAEDRAREALDVAVRLDDRVAQWYLLSVLACCAAAAGEHVRAAVLLGGAELLRTGTGGTVNATVAPALERARRTVSRTLSASRAAGHEASGAALPRPELVAVARRQRPAPAVADAHPAGTGPLPPRETEVAQLVADGLTNKEIGARLGISDRTVESHVGSILTRLGMRTRSQVAAWAVRQR